MTRFRSIVFDFDGVLVDSNAIKRDAYRQALQHKGATTELLNRCLAEHPDGDRTGIIRMLLRHLSPRADESEVVSCVSEYSRICLESISTCPEVDGASAALEILHAEYPLYINSATPEEPLHQIVSARGWSGFFRGVLGRPSSKLANFARIQAAEGVPAEMLLFVGDRQADFDVALKCGCAFVGVQSDENDFRDATPPIVIPTLQGLPALVQHLADQ